MIDDDKSSSVMFSVKIAEYCVGAIYNNNLTSFFFRWAEAAEVAVREHVFWNLNEALLNRMTIRWQVHAVVAKWD